MYDFVRETREDHTSPNTSNFVKRIPQCKETVTKLEEVIINPPTLFNICKIFGDPSLKK